MAHTAVLGDTIIAIKWSSSHEGEGANGTHSSVLLPAQPVPSLGRLNLVREGKLRE